MSVDLTWTVYRPIVLILLFESVNEDVVRKMNFFRKGAHDNFESRVHRELEYCC